MKAIDKATKYYQANKSELKGLYGGKYIVIVGNAVTGAYDTHAQAYAIRGRNIPDTAHQAEPIKLKQVYPVLLNHLLNAVIVNSDIIFGRLHMKEFGNGLLIWLAEQLDNK